MGSGPGRPVKTHGPPHGPGGAAHIEPTSHRPRPGPAHQIPRGCAAARPGPSKFHSMGRGLARPIKISEDGPRPGPAHHIANFSRPGPAHQFFKSLGPAGPARHNSQIGPARPRQTAHDKPWKFRSVSVGVVFKPSKNENETEHFSVGFSVKPAKKTAFQRTQRACVGIMWRPG